MSKKAPLHERLREFATWARPNTELRALLIEAAEALEPKQKRLKSTAEHDPRGYELSEEGSID